MTKPDYLLESFTVGISFLGAACLVLATFILAGIIPFEKAAESLGTAFAGLFSVLGALGTAYQTHREKVRHDRRSIAKALTGEVAAIRTWLYNACNNPPDWNLAYLGPFGWSEAVQSLRPPPLTIYSPETFKAIGGLDHHSVIKFVEFRGYCEMLLHQIDVFVGIDPERGPSAIHTLMKLLDTVGRQADDVAVLLATNFEIKLSFSAPWPPYQSQDHTPIHHRRA